MELDLYFFLTNYHSRFRNLNIHVRILDQKLEAQITHFDHQGKNCSCGDRVKHSQNILPNAKHSQVRCICYSIYLLIYIYKGYPVPV